MITEATLTSHAVAAQIYAVSQAAYRLEAKWIGCTDFPPLRESLAGLQQSSESFLVFQSSGTIIGALSFDRAADPVFITRLVVNPAHLRQGIATALLAELERRLPPATRLAVSTAQANTPGVSLYKRLGYTPADVTHSPEGIPLIHLVKSTRSDKPEACQAIAGG